MKNQISTLYLFSLIFTFLIFHLAFIPVNAHAMAFKWIGEQDKAHFSDNPPSNMFQNNNPPQPPLNGTQKTTEANPEPQTSSDELLKSFSEKHGDPLEKNIEEIINNLSKVFAKVIKDILKIVGKKLENVGAGFGDWLEVAIKNLPDIQLEEYRNKDEEFQQGVKNLLLGAYLICQFQFMVEGSTTCSKKKLNISEEMSKEYKNYVVFIDPEKNSPKDLLISAYHKQIGDVWEITHLGKQSLREVRHNKKKGL